MTIHNKINAKGNLQNWLGSKSFSRHVVQAMKTGYEQDERLKTGSRFYYRQDCKTNHQEPREPYYEGNGEFASDH